MAKAKRFTINNDDREGWIMNCEGWYLLHKQSHMSVRQFITLYRVEIDADIRRNS